MHNQICVFGINAHSELVCKGIEPTFLFSVEELNQVDWLVVGLRPIAWRRNPSLREEGLPWVAFYGILAPIYPSLGEKQLNRFRVYQKLSHGVPVLRETARSILTDDPMVLFKLKKQDSKQLNMRRFFFIKVKNQSFNFLTLCVLLLVHPDYFVRPI